jgi:predicted transcriptional regulator
LGNDFQIERFGNVFIEFEKLDDDDLSVYNGIGGYYNNYDEYVDSDDVQHYIDSSWGEISKGVKEDIIIQYNHEGIDIMAYLRDNGIEYGGSYLHGLLSDADKIDDFDEKVEYIISRAKESAREQAEQEVASKAEDLFRMGDNEIDKDVFLLYLISQDGEYDMESFKDFLSSRFDIPTESYEIYDEINEKSDSYLNVEVKEIVEAYSDLVEEIIEHDIEHHSDEYRNYHLKTNPDTSDYYQNTHSDDISNHMYKLQQEIYQTVHKFTNEYDLFFSDDYRDLRIFDTKINPPQESVYIKFEDKVGTNDFIGYVKISDLPRYINYNENASEFYAKLGKTLSGLGLDNRNDTFENELVKLKINYGNVDVVNDMIYIELMDKASGRVDKGMVKVESLPTYYTNHKLFEALVRFKKLL